MHAPATSAYLYHDRPAATLSGARVAMNEPAHKGALPSQAARRRPMEGG